MQPVKLDHLHGELEEPGGHPDGQRGPREAREPGADGFSRSDADPSGRSPVAVVAQGTERPKARRNAGEGRYVPVATESTLGREWGDSLVAERSSI